MGAREVQVFVTGSNRLTSGIPTPPLECPPANSALPSVMRTGPEQKMLSDEGTYVSAPVDQFHRYAMCPESKASHRSTSPVRNSIIWTSLIGKLNGADHWPLTEGPPPEPPLETLTLIALVVRLPAASRATALSV